MYGRDGSVLHFEQRVVMLQKYTLILKRINKIGWGGRTLTCKHLRAAGSKPAESDIPPHPKKMVSPTRF